MFRGGCTVETAEAVAGADLDTLQSLVDKSLLRHTGERFWMLETIREYAARAARGGGEDDAMRRRHAEHVLELAEEAEPHLRERLDESGATAEMPTAHAAWCLGLAEEAEPELSMERQSAWFAVLDLERDNVRAALSYLADVGEAELRLRLTVALTRFWYVRGHLTEGRGWLELCARRRRRGRSHPPAARAYGGSIVCPAPG